MPQCHEIDYTIHGAEMQFVEVALDPEETAIAEAGAMMYMDQGIEMEAVLGDGSHKTSGLMGKMLGVGRRMLTGESLFITTFTNRWQGKKVVAFSSPYPGKIVPLNLAELDGAILCQRDSFLCAARGTVIGVALQRRLATGFFGGEGFILQKLEGDGYAFIHAGGTIVERQLNAGETLYVDTGCVIALQPSVDFDITLIKGIKSLFFGGEGIFLAKMTGPGRVWLQSTPFGRIEERIEQSILSQVQPNRG